MFIRLLALIGLILAPRVSAQQVQAYRINLLFIFVENQPTGRDYEAWLKPQVEITEKLFTSSIPFDVRWKVGTENSAQNLEFATNKGFHKYMDKRFDAKLIDGEYWYPVVVVNSLYFRRERKRSEGKSYLPQRHGRRHGIMLTYQSDAATLAHELGHVFGLKHPWQPYIIGKKCNRQIEGSREGPGGTNNEAKRSVNLMDVRRKEGFTLSLTACQRERMFRYIHAIAETKGLLPAEILTK